MDTGATEIEVKFHIRSVRELERQILSHDGRLESVRVLETNLRFDDPQGSLAAAHQVLRLRQDLKATLTFKGPGEMRDGILRRLELETRVDDLDDTRSILEALGYVVVFIYEKYRTVYGLTGTHVMLDELPCGGFVEIEGEHSAIHAVSDLLHLRWASAVEDSYAGIFMRLCAAQRLDFRDMTFSSMQGIRSDLVALGIAPAD
jgi:adenylate cyclase class 2